MTNTELRKIKKDKIKLNKDVVGIILVILLTIFA